jgi:hypothetical protein
VHNNCCQRKDPSYLYVRMCQMCASVPISHDFISLFPTDDTLRCTICLFVLIRKNIPSAATAGDTRQNQNVFVAPEWCGGSVSCLISSTYCVSISTQRQHCCENDGGAGTSTYVRPNRSSDAFRTDCKDDLDNACRIDCLMCRFWFGHIP